MELIYTVSSSLKKDYTSDKYPFLVSLSSKNVLAFCTTVEIDEKKKTSPKCCDVTEHHIYVCDIDKPWYAHKLTSSPHKIVSLEWHPLGLKLFYADSAGNCYIYRMKNLLNVWENIAQVTIKSPGILQAVWLQQERKVSFLADKKDSNSYFEKFQSESVYNPFFSYDGDGSEGILVVSSRQLTLLVVPEEGLSEVNIITNYFNKVDGPRRVCDIWLAEDRILMVSSSGFLSSLVRCHSLVIESKNGKPNLRHEPTFNFSVDHPRQNNSCCGSESHDPECFCLQEVIFLKFLSSSSILVSYNVSGSGHVELWHLTSDKVVTSGYTKKHIQGEFQSLDTSKQSWRKVATLSHNSLITSIAVPQLQVVQQHQNQQQDVGYESSESFVRYVAVAYKDGSAKLVNRLTFVWMATTHLDTGNINERWESPEKKAKLMTPHLVHMQQSYTGCILIGIDQNCCIYVMKAINTRDPVTQVSSAVLVGLLECLMATSRDSWDVLAAIKPGSAEAIQHRLRENFKKQPISVQEMHLNRIQSLNSLLAGCLNNPIKSGESYCRCMVYLINGHLKSLMVPKSINSIDTFTLERFCQICKNLDLDLDTLLMNIPSDKKFIADSQGSGHLLYLLRWCISLATYLVCVALPCTTAVGRSYHHCNVQQIGSGLLGDTSTLGAIRELIVMAKMWSSVMPGILRDCQSSPVVVHNMTASEKISQLFRLLTKVYQHVLESKEFDDMLVDECLSFAVINPRFTVVKYGLGSQFDPEILFGPNYKETCSMFTQNLPLSFTFLRRPSYEVIKRCTRTDSVRQFYVDPFQFCRICSRCGNFSLSRDKTFKWPTTSNPWEMKFESTCCCGGMWRMNTL